MGVIYRFSAKYIHTPSRLSDDLMALRIKLTPHQVETGPYHLSQLLANISANKAKIGTDLRPYGDSMSRQAVGTSITVAGGVGVPMNIAQKAIAKAFVLPQMKLYAHNNYTLSVNEELDASGLCRLELVFEADNLGKHIVLATSDPTPAKAIALKFKQPGAPSGAPAPSAGAAPAAAPAGSS